MSEMFGKLWSEDSGATAVEYALMGSLIAAVIIGAVVLLGQQVNAALGSVQFEP